LLTTEDGSEQFNLVGSIGTGSGGILGYTRTHRLGSKEAPDLRKGLGVVAASYTQDVVTGHLRVQLPSVISPSTMTLEGLMGSYELEVPNAARLSMRRDSNPVLLGDQGWVTYAEGVRMAYVMWPRLSIRGVVNGREVSGHGWLEHQWGDVAIGDLTWRYLFAQVGEQQVIAWVAKHRGAPEPVQFAGLLSNEGVRALTDVRVDPFDVHGLRIGTRLSCAEGEVVWTPSSPDQVVRLGYPTAKPVFEGHSEVTGRLNGAEVQGWGMTEIHPWRA
tara:strand:- start:26 stop:847 length:822 start_codon:yes stop_codon:yes gene_type:complete